MQRRARSRSVHDISILQQEWRCAVSNSDTFCVLTRFQIGSQHCAAAFYLQVPKSCTDLDPTLLFENTGQIRMGNKRLALGISFPQLRNPVRAQAAGLPCQDYDCQISIFFDFFLQVKHVFFRKLPLRSDSLFAITQIFSPLFV